MPDLEDVTDSSDDKEGDIPSSSATSEDEDDLYSDYKVPERSEKSANIEEGYDSMPELIPDYENLEDDNSEDGNFSRVFLDGEAGRRFEW